MGKEKTKIEGKRKTSDKSVLTLLIIMIPSLLIAMASSVTILWVKVMIQAVLLFFQFIVVKSFIEDYQKLKTA